VVLADKRELRQKVRRVERVKTWQLVIILLMAGFVAATFLRLNNVGMIERRDAVIEADKSGDERSLERRLYDLQRYTSSHMNASPGRIALEHTYKRMYDRALDKFEKEVASQSGNNVVAKVREHCDNQAKQGGYGRWWSNADPRYVACINEEWDKYPAATSLSLHFTAPPADPYYHTFVSPAWSPDFAGWSLVVCGLIILVIIIRLVVIGVLKLLIARQYRQV